MFVIFPNTQAIADYLAKYITQKIIANPATSLGLATGSTMEPYGQLSEATQAQLQEWGYHLVTQGWNLGDIQAIQVVDGEVQAVADPRGRGVAKVFHKP